MFSAMRERLGSYHICLVLQSGIIIDRDPILHLPRRLYTSLFLLHDVPGRMREMLLLPGPHMNVRALRIRKSLQLGGLG